MRPPGRWGRHRRWLGEARPWGRVGWLDRAAARCYTPSMDTLNRRGVLAAGAAAALAGLARAQPQPKPAEGKYPGDSHRGPVSIASLNGLRAVARAMELSKQGYDPADCIVQGVRIIEDDPNDTSVGLGGEPNEDGVVELDSSVMHGPTHKSGAVAALQNIKNPAMVALLVLRKTDHCL